MLRIHQNLLSKEHDLGKISKVYSHAQSLAQCHEWLNHNLPGVPRISVASNSLAAQMAADEPGAAAIAGVAAAERFALPRLVENIEDEPNNTTRFLVLGKHDLERDKQPDPAQHSKCADRFRQCWHQWLKIVGLD